MRVYLQLPLDGGEVATASCYSGVSKTAFIVRIMSVSAWPMFVRYGTILMVYLWFLGLEQSPQRSDVCLGNVTKDVQCTKEKPKDLPKITESFWSGFIA